MVFNNNNNRYKFRFMVFLYFNELFFKIVMVYSGYIFFVLIG